MSFIFMLINSVSNKQRNGTLSAHTCNNNSNKAYTQSDIHLQTNEGKKIAKKNKVGIPKIIIIIHNKKKEKFE